MKKPALKIGLSKFVDTLSQTIRRFAVAIILAALAAVVMIVFVHVENNLDQTQTEWFQRIAMVLVLGVPLSLFVQVLLETFLIDRKWLGPVLYSGAVVLLALYLFFGLPEFSSVSMMRYTGLQLFFWGLFLVTPFLGGKPQVEIHTFSIGWRLLVTLFYCGIIYGGLAGILLSLKELLNVPIIDAHYADTFYVLAGIILPTFFFAGIPTKTTKLPETHTKFFKILLLYVLMPILVAYTAVLYIYFLRMLFEQALPKNIIGNLVLWYAIVGVLVLYLSKAELATNKWAKLFSRWFPLLLLVPLGMMFTAIFLRIKQYGFTEPRYFTVIGGIWVLSMALYTGFSRQEKRKNVIIPLTATLLAFLSVMGPWGAFSVSMASQNHRLDTLLVENNMVSAGTLLDGTALDNETKSQISSSILYFDRTHSLDDIKSLDGYTTIEGIEADLGFELNGETYAPDTHYYYFYQDSDSHIFDIVGYDYLMLSRHGDAVIQSNIGVIEISGSQYKDNPEKVDPEILVTLNGKTIFQQSIYDYTIQLNEKYPNRKALSAEEMTFVHTVDNMTLKVVFSNIEANDDTDNTWSGWADYMIFIDINE